MEILHYLTTSGTDPFQQWLDRLPDRGGRDAVLRRLNRLTAGHFGVRRHCRDGVWELCIDRGPGYRIYYALANRTTVVVLGGGSKRRQDTDIEQAVRRWRAYQRTAT